MNRYEALVAIVRSLPPERRSRTAVLAIAVIGSPVLVASVATLAALWK